MSTEENKAFIRRYLEALNYQDKPAALVSEYVAHAHLRRHIADFEAAFPRYGAEVEDLIAEGDKVVVRATFHGTHTGKEFAGLPPTGKQWSVPGIVIYRIAEGKIVDFWIQADTLGLLQQLGAAPAPGQTGGR